MDGVPCGRGVRLGRRTNPAARTARGRPCAKAESGIHPTREGGRAAPQERISPTYAKKAGRNPANCTPWDAFLGFGERGGAGHGILKNRCGFLGGHNTSARSAVTKKNMFSKNITPPVESADLLTPPRDA